MKSLTRSYYLLLAVALALLVPTASRAQLVFTAENVSVFPGNPGSFDLTMTNTGPDLNLRGWTGGVTLTNNPTHDVRLDQFIPGSDGQFMHFFQDNQLFSIGTGQTITLETVGFNSVWNTAANVVGIQLSDLNGFKAFSQDGVPSTGVNGSITVLGPPLIFTLENVSVDPGGSGSFDLTMTNIGPDLNLRGWTGGVTLTNNPTHDVRLDQFIPGSDGQFMHFFQDNNLFSIGTGQTITLKTIGFNAAPGAVPNVVGVQLSDLNGFKAFSQDGVLSTGVNGSITVSGPSSVPEPGALALLSGLAIPGVAFLIRRRRV